MFKFKILTWKFQSLQYSGLWYIIQERNRYAGYGGQPHPRNLLTFKALQQINLYVPRTNNDWRDPVELLRHNSTTTI